MNDRTREAILEYLKDDCSEDEVLTIVRDLNGYNSRLEDLVWEDFDEYNIRALLSGFDTMEIIRKVCYGNVRYTDNYWRFDSYGNMETTSSLDYDDTDYNEIVDEIDEIPYQYLPDEIKSIINEYDNEEYEEDEDEDFNGFENRQSRKNNHLKENLRENIDYRLLTKGELWELRCSLIIGSMYISDYKNKFGIDPEKVCNLFDGYVDELCYTAKEQGVYNDNDWYDSVKQFDDPETLYNYYLDWCYGCGDDVANCVPVIMLNTGMYENHKHKTISRKSVVERKHRR